jgi:hypothetical protein
LCKFPKSLYIQKFKFYSEIIFPLIPAHPAQPRVALARFAPQAAVRALGPLGLSSLGIFAKRRLFFEFAQSVNGVSSLSHRCQVGPTHQIHPLPRVGRPESRLHRASPQLFAPCLPASIIEMPIKAAYSPALNPPLESPLTTPRPQPSMASAANRRSLLTGISTPSSPAPYKRRAPLPLFFSSLHA